MRGSKSRPGQMAWAFLLSAAAVCLASGTAFAMCTPSLSGIFPGDGDVPCYIKVQPVDVCLSNGLGCAPFNTTSTNGIPLGKPSSTPPVPAAGAPFSVQPNFPSFTNGVPNNATSLNPIGFVVDPTTGLSPGQLGYSGTGVDITRALLNNIGVELVWFPMEQYSSPSGTNFTTLTITQTTNTVATCTGSITGITLTITGACTGTPGTLAVTDALSGGTIASGTVITGMITGKGGAGTYTVSTSQTVSKTTITATTTILTSTGLQALTQQTPGTNPCPISKMTIPPNSNGNTCGSPVFPRNTDASTINMFFVSKLNPPASGGTLYGISWIGNNGIAIGGNTFFAPTPLQARPDTIAHELLHDLGLDHTTFGAGPWVPPTLPNANPPSYTPPFGVAPPIPTNPLFGECDPSYPACGANLMSAGNLRTEPSVACVLNGFSGDQVSACSGLPSLYNGMADQVTPLDPDLGYGIATSAQLPMSQQQQVLAGMSGLLSPNVSGGIIVPPLMQSSGLINPIPYETTKAQLGTGDSATDRAIFDLPGPTGGKPGETLVAWVLTLPPGKTFAKHDRFHVASQSRQDLVEGVKYYPDGENNPLMKDIAYYSDIDNNWANPRASYTPCTSATAECLMVKFRSPGLGAHDFVSFSKSIVKSILFSKGLLSRGGAPITNNDLCNAKITYMFSDGFATTSNFGHCPPASLQLISSSWRPDPTIAPRIIKPKKTNVLLAQLSSSAPSGADVTGSAWVLRNAALNATIVAPSSLGAADVTFTVPSSACSGMQLTLCFNDISGGIAVNDFLTGGGATNITEITPGALAASVYGNGQNSSTGTGTLFQFTGIVTVSNGEIFQATHDDGASLQINGIDVFSSPGPTNAIATSGTYTGPSGTFPFVLVYGQCCGLPAVLDISLPLESQIVSLPGTPDPNNPNQLLFDLTQTGCTDCDPTKEGGQPGQACNNGNLTGTIYGNVTVSAGQNCVFKSPCEITGNLTINGGNVYLGCTLDGSLSENGGTLNLVASSRVTGGVNISQASTFTIGPAATIKGNLQIQNLPANEPQPGVVCGTTVTGNLTVQNNQSPVQIGELATQQNCPGNTIGGSLQCTGNNPVPTSGSNTVGAQFKGQCSG